MKMALLYAHEYHKAALEILLSNALVAFLKSSGLPLNAPFVGGDALRRSRAALANDRL